MGGCGCGKRRKSLQASGFVVRHPDGGRTTHSTRLEADAENARRSKGAGRVVEKR